MRPARQAAATMASAVPSPPVASAPVLQCVSTAPSTPGRSRPWRARGRVPLALAGQRPRGEGPERAAAGVPVLARGLRRRQRLVDHGAEVGGGGARGLQLGGGAGQRLPSRAALLARDGHAAGAGHAQQGRTAHAQGADGLGHGGHGAQAQAALLVRQQRLVERLHALARQDAQRLDGAHGASPTGNSTSQTVS